MKQENYVIGIDFGTGSVRAIIVDARSGEEMAASEYAFPRWKEGQFCDASKNQFRQHPLDHVEGLEQSIRGALLLVSREIQKNIRAISVATTGSTPVAVDENGIPLALHPEFADNPNAMFFLWKDHTAVKEAEEINEHAKKFDIDYLKYVGGTYSSEWFWAKLLYVLRNDEEVREACHSWVENCDWIPFMLTGGGSVSEIKRNVCVAGHKALWSEDFNGLPKEEFLSSLDPLLSGFRRKLYTSVHTSDRPAGKLCPEWAHILGLSTDVLVGIGAMDAHMGAVGGQIEPYYLSKVMGTSTCDMMIAPVQKMDGVLIRGICGQVNGSIVPGMVGMEAGQSAFGDIYSWFRDIVFWPAKKLLPQTKLIDKTTVKLLQEEIRDSILKELSAAAAEIPIDENAELAVDWMNGRRTPDANQFLKGAIQNLNLGSDAPRIFRSLVESTCFGSRRIVERFVEEGIPIKGVIAVGGVAKKSPLVVQMMADILGMPIKVHRSEQTCALGAAMFAATVAGIYPKVEVAMDAMGPGFDKEFNPDMEKYKAYNIRYEKYKLLCGFIADNYMQNE
ncbi:ribulokinase [Flavobacteriaceae bacterium F89]|uniref:Ribulokinase n=1 Tax=Cerina litoralis TaxID=2874477 RepID=A0AAE3JPQ9_9FLAO|nr:ribulokinase [Cerina litoralis]MCG2462375.1 ribulokinase [Cerina litoralis]